MRNQTLYLKKEQPHSYHLAYDLQQPRQYQYQQTQQLGKSFDPSRKKVPYNQQPQNSLQNPQKIQQSCNQGQPRQRYRKRRIKLDQGQDFFQTLHTITQEIPKREDSQNQKESLTYTKRSESHSLPLTQKQFLANPPQYIQRGISPGDSNYESFKTLPQIQQALCQMNSQQEIGERKAKERFSTATIQNKGQIKDLYQKICGLSIENEKLKNQIRNSDKRLSQIKEESIDQKNNTPQQKSKNPSVYQQNMKQNQPQKQMLNKDEFRSKSVRYDFNQDYSQQTNQQRTHSIKRDTFQVPLFPENNDNLLNKHKFGEFTNRRIRKSQSRKRPNSKEIIEKETFIKIQEVLPAKEKEAPLMPDFISLQEQLKEKKQEITQQKVIIEEINGDNSNLKIKLAEVKINLVNEQEKVQEGEQKILKLKDKLRESKKLVNEISNKLNEKSALDFEQKILKAIEQKLSTVKNTSEIKTENPSYNSQNKQQGDQVLQLKKKIQQISMKNKILEENQKKQNQDRKIIEEITNENLELQNNLKILKKEVADKNLEILELKKKNLGIEDFQSFEHNNTLFGDTQADIIKGQEEKRNQEIRKLSERNEQLESQLQQIKKKFGYRQQVLQKIPDLDSDEEIELQKEELLDELKKSMKESVDIQRESQLKEFRLKQRIEDLIDQKNQTQETLTELKNHYESLLKYKNKTQKKLEERYANQKRKSHKEICQLENKINSQQNEIEITKIKLENKDDQCQNLRKSLAQIKKEIEDLKIIELSYFNQIKELELEIQNYDEQRSKLIQQNKEEQKQTQQQFKELIDTIKEDFSKRLEEQQDLVQDSQAQLHNVILENENYKSNLNQLENVLKNQAKDFDMELERCETELIQTKNQNEEILHTLKIKDQEIMDIKMANQTNINEIRSYYEQELEKQQDLAKNLYDDLQKSKEINSYNTQQLETKLKQKQAIDSDIDQNIKQLEQQYQRVQGDYFNALQENENLEKEKSDLLKTLKNFMENLKELKIQLKESEKEIFSLQLQIKKNSSSQQMWAQEKEELGNENLKLGILLQEAHQELQSLAQDREALLFKIFHISLLNHINDQKKQFNLIQQMFKLYQSSYKEELKYFPQPNNQQFELYLRQRPFVIVSQKEFIRP